MWATAATEGPSGRGTISIGAPIDVSGVPPVLRRVLGTQHMLQSWTRAYPWVVDLAVVLALPPVVLFAAGSVASSGYAWIDVPGWVAHAGSVALILPLLVRRRYPGAVFVAVAASAPVHVGLGFGLMICATLLVALYSLARHGSMQTVAWVCAPAAVVVWASGWSLLPGSGQFLLLLMVTCVGVGAVVVGLVLRTRMLYLAALEQRALRMEIEHHQRILLSAAAERERIAREMHDIVSHNLSVVIGLADGAGAALTAAGVERTDGRRGTSVETAAEGLRLIATSGREALAELRRVLGVLRDGSDDAWPGPVPCIADLEVLLGRVRAAGLPVTLRTQRSVDRLGPGVQLAVYRIVQEALTNTLRHAGRPARATVEIGVNAGQVRVRVVDSGTPRPEGSGDSGHGQGLAGIRQRAAVLDGSAEMGPRPGAGGWVVDVRLAATRLAS